MKRMIQLFLLCLPLTATAQPPGMNQQDMQKMMEGMQKMQECMRNVDQSAMEAMASKAEAIEKRIQTLCQAGRRDQAQNLAIDFGRKMASSEAMKQMRQCGEMMRGRMPEMAPKTTLPSEEELKKRHICDHY